jgi:adenosine deaminase
LFQTDDVGVFGSPLSNEYALVARYFGLGRAEICALVRKGVEVIFGGDEEKTRLRRILQEE